MDHTTGTIIDLATGEIIEEAFEQVNLEGMPLIGRILKSLAGSADHLSVPRPAWGPGSCLCSDCNLAREAGRVHELYLARSKKLTDQREQMMEKAEHLHGLAGQKSLKYPGVGLFGTIKGRVSLDGYGWDALNADEQKVIAVAHSDNLPTVTTVKPAKKAILEELQADTLPESLRLYFKVKTGPDTFRFKPE